MHLKHSLLPVLLLLAVSIPCHAVSVPKGVPVLEDTAVSITDDRGKTITLATPATRIIALYGAFNEILAELGKEGTIIARTKADTVPASIRSKPSIGTHMRPNPELVAGLQPDIVFQMGGRKKALDSVLFLEQLGIPVAFFSITSFEDLFSVIKRIGTITGSTPQATAVCTSLRERLSRVQKQTALLHETPTVFFEVRYPNLLGAGKASIVNDIISYAGGTNIMDMPTKLVRINEEEIIKRNPQVYLIQEGAMNPAPQPMEQRPHFRTIQAVTAGRVYILDEALYSRPGPRAVAAVEELAALLHPSWTHSTVSTAGDN